MLSNNNNNNNNNNNDDDDDNSRPDIVVLEKEGRVCFIVDVACLFDTQVAEKETEKIDHFKQALHLVIPLSLIINLFVYKSLSDITILGHPW